MLYTLEYPWYKGWDEFRIINMLKVWTAAVPIETMARRFFVFFIAVFVCLFFLNGYDLLTGYTCTRVPVHNPTSNYTVGMAEVRVYLFTFYCTVTLVLPSC
jgi:hypothetical protein